MNYLNNIMSSLIPQKITLDIEYIYMAYGPTKIREISKRYTCKLLS